MKLTNISEPVDETPADDAPPTPAAETAPEVKTEPAGVPADEQPADEPPPVANATGPDKPLADYCAAFGDAAEALDPIVAPNGAAFARRRGILTEMLDEIMPRLGSGFSRSTFVWPAMPPSSSSG